MEDKKSSINSSSPILAHSALSNPEIRPTVDPTLVMSRLRESETLDKIHSILNQRGISKINPLLKLELEVPAGQASPQLDSDDLKKIFSQFGEIINITLDPKTKASALILFKDMPTAFMALKSLNGQNIPSLNAKLSLKWVLDSEPISSIPLADLPPSYPSELNGGAPLFEDSKSSPVITPESNYNGMTSKYYQNSGIYDPQNSQAKYTCRFDIQIENDKEFQVAKKLIGAKGSNMKRIVELCCKGCLCPVQDVIKLRLRGKGSGFKEGPNQQESSEPLHLCISSRYFDKYSQARQLAKDLILEVYEDYKKYCEKIGKECTKLEIKLSENVSGNRPRGTKSAAMSGGSVRPIGGMLYGNSTLAQAHNGNYYYEGNTMPRGVNPYYPPTAYQQQAYFQHSQYENPPLPDMRGSSQYMYPGVGYHHSE